MTNVLDDMARHLAAAGVGDYATDRELDPGQVPIAVGGTPETDGPAITLTLYPGPAPDSRNGWETPRLQVRVRHADPLAAVDLDRQVYAELQAIGPMQLPDHDADGQATFLQDCYALQSAPMPMGQDRSGRWEYSRNYQLHTQLV